MGRENARGFRYDTKLNSLKNKKKIVGPTGGKYPPSLSAADQNTGEATLCSQR